MEDVRQRLDGMGLSGVTMEQLSEVEWRLGEIKVGEVNWHSPWDHTVLTKLCDVGKEGSGRTRALKQSMFQRLSLSMWCSQLLSSLTNQHSQEGISWRL